MHYKIEGGKTRVLLNVPLKHCILRVPGKCLDLPEKLPPK